MNKKKYLISISIIFFLIIILIFFYSNINKFKKEKDQLSGIDPIVINLLASVHPSLLWNFKPIKPKIIVKPGEVATIEYIVENPENKATTGIATFSYYPKQFGAYISKLNCFCYDAQTLEPKQKERYTVVLLIDPEVTKDSKTKNVKEVTIQFTFFDYKEYKEQKS